MRLFGHRVGYRTSSAIGVGLVVTVLGASVFFGEIWSRHTPSEPPRQIPSAEPIRVSAATDPFENGRNEYIERRHGSPSGVDWRRMDRETRDRIRRERQARVRDLMRNHTPDPGDPIVESVVIESINRQGLPTTKQGASEEIAGLCGTWVERGSTNQAGRMLTADVARDGTIYAASDGGIIWSGTLAGNDWRSLNDHYTFDQITMVKSVAKPGHDRLLVLDSRGLHRTDSNGIIWESFDSWNHTQTVNGVFKADEERVIVAVTEWNYDVSDTELVLYGSDDLGVSFQRLDSIITRRFSTIIAPVASDGTASVYVMADEIMYRLDADNTLEPLGALPLPDGSIHQIHMSKPALIAGSGASDETTLYVALPLAVPNQDGGWDVGTHFFASFDGGFGWEYRSFSRAGAFGRNSFACSSLDPTRVFFGAACELLLSSDDSAGTWTTPDYGWSEYYSDPLNKLHCDLSGINVFRDALGEREFLLIHTDGGTYVSEDAGQTVTNLSLSNLRCSQYYSTYTHRDDPSLLFAGSQDQGFQRTDQTQHHHIWTFDQLILGDDANIVSADGGETLWWTYPGILRFLDDASTSDHASQFSYRHYLANAMWLPPLLADPDNPRRVYLGGGNPHEGGAQFPRSQLFWVSLEDGAFWWGFEPQEFAAGITALAASPIDTDYRYVLTDDAGFYFSPDKGQSWTRSQVPHGSAQFGASITACPSRFGRVYIGGSGYQGPPVRVSYDHGATFEDFSLGLPRTLVNDLAASSDGALVFAATEVGPFVAAADDGVWHYMGGVTAPDQAYMSVEFLDGVETARFATYGRGVWDFEIGDCPTRLREGGWRVVP